MDTYNLRSGKKYINKEGRKFVYSHSEIMSFGKVYQFKDEAGSLINFSEKQVKDFEEDSITEQFEEIGGFTLSDKTIKKVRYFFMSYNIIESTFFSKKIVLSGNCFIDTDEIFPNLLEIEKGLYEAHDNVKSLEDGYVKIMSILEITKEEYEYAKQNLSNKNIKLG
jgi:hypothetical protein